MIAGLACAGSQAQQFCAAVFGAAELFEYESVARVLQTGTFTFLVLLFVRRDSGGFALALGFLALSHVLAGLFLGGSLKWRLGHVGLRLNLGVVRKWYGEAVHVGLLDLVRRLTLEVDNVLLSWLQPAAILGIYSVAYRPLVPLNWVPQAILTAAFPSFARLAHGERKALDSAASIETIR